MSFENMIVFKKKTQLWVCNIFSCFCLMMLTKAAFIYLKNKNIVKYYYNLK